MDNDRIETLLLKLLEDMAVVKSRLDSIEEIKLDTIIYSCTVRYNS